MLNKYVGGTVTIIYQDRKGQLSQRQIEVRAIRDGIVKAYCLTSQQPRTFIESGILAVDPSKRKAV